MVKTNPDEPIIVIGHSWGGASSVKSQRELSADGVDIDLLITVDPVSWIMGASGKKEGSSTKWVNLKKVSNIALVSCFGLFGLSFWE